MDVDARLRETLERESVRVHPDVPGALREVRATAGRRTTRRRVVASVAAIGATAGLVAALAGAHGALHRSHPGPSHESGTPTVSLSIVRQRSAADLGIGQALSVAVASDGHVFVTDTSQHVTELTADLRVVRSWGGGGTAPGRFRMIQGSVATGPHDRVYVSDTGNFRVQVFSHTGRFLRQVGTFGTGPGQFTWPFDLTVDPRGNLYVADDKAETLTKLDPTGHQLWRRGEAGVETDPRLLGHEHLAGFDPQGDLVVADDDRGVVFTLTPGGRVVTSFGTTDAQGLDDPTASTGLGAFPRGACDVTVDDQGRVYVTSCDEAPRPHWTGVFLRDGTPVGTWVDNPVTDSPRWGPAGRGYVVTTNGGVAEVRASVH